MKRRVVVTGLGAITPIGNSVQTFWQNVHAETVGISPVTKFNTEGYRVRLAAEVKHFDPVDYMERKEAGRMAEFAQYAVAAASEAIGDSGLKPDEEDAFRCGCIIGSSIGNMKITETEYTKILQQGPGRASIFTVPMMIGNMAAGNVSIRFGLRGKCSDVVTACASGTHSIGDALRTIQYGDADVMVAGGAEATICPTALAGFAAMRALSETADPAAASIPFDRKRNGFVLGEGAGVVVLEELEHALRRGAKIYAELCGYGATADACHITSPSMDGSGPAKAMELAMQEAGVGPDTVDYINAHGTSTHLNDLCETKAIRMALGDRADRIYVNSTKSMVGHLLGAAGAVEFITCVKSMEEGFIHRNVGTTDLDPECNLNIPITGPVYHDIHCCISNSMGFGGHNGALLLRRYERSSS